MRQAQVYRWQLPMDAGVVLRERRLKTRDGLLLQLRDGEREGWGEISPCLDSVWKRWMRRRQRCWHGRTPGAKARMARCRRRLQPPSG